ncbi:hypothetical protein QR680_017920 [Steinernema hermaphroditum]|uniref:Uncharacterized protein n=1 Tax=Steinernema hermaphroditum TaxID=289476 RepID=A0AA39HH05_9BILA|nr:hypothetical protein QR680_017920 [Steinernema hermaphroditum]
MDHRNSDRSTNHNANGYDKCNVLGVHFADDFFFNKTGTLHCIHVVLQCYNRISNFSRPSEHNCGFSEPNAVPGFFYWCYHYEKVYVDYPEGDQSTDVGCNRISISDDVGTCHHFYFITFPHISYNDSKKYGLKEFTDFDCRRNHNRNIHRWHIYRILHDIDIYVHFETHHCSNI